MANLNPGIHENVSLAKLSYVEGGTWEGIDFLFAKDDMFFKHRVFKPKPENTEKAREHINYILAHFTTRDKIKAVVGKNFKDFADKLVELYKDEKMFNTKVHIKLMKNEKGYAAIPSFMTHGFMQDGDIACSLAYTDWEIANNHAPVLDAVPAKAGAVDEDADDQLPF